MKSFLHIVAQDLLDKYGSNLRDVTVVFPGKRASLFLNQELAQLSKSPVWAPRYVTIGDMLKRLSCYETADPIDCICTLYQIFHEIMGEEDSETLDQFYGWGEIILSDFDDIDKHLADAESIFSNVYELKQLEDNSFLEPEQIETLQHFFQNFSLEHNSQLKERFLQIWGNMKLMYDQLKENLKQNDTLYEGAAFRLVAEALQRGDEQLMNKLSSYGKVVFAGFNVLNEVERTLMKTLKKNGQASFYWDYDIFYTSDPTNEAGTFMRQNLKDFGSAVDVEAFDNLCNLQDVTIISTNNDNVQARYIYDWLKTSPMDSQENRNAVILCNENLLQPVLHSLPSKEEVQLKHGPNITMGFPLTDTPIYSLINALFNLQTDGYDTLLRRFRQSFQQTVSHHPYASYMGEEWLEYNGLNNQTLLAYLIRMTECVGRHFSDIEHPDVYTQLYIEAIFQTHNVLSKFYQIVTREQSPLRVQSITLRRLLRRVLQTTSIPFHGEPALGLQIMGVLETRCLDFSNMVILSLEEGNLPKGIHSSSMIPANLREAFHLTTIRHKISVYAYYFYRLIQRSEHITCVYNENTTGVTRHEISRFLRQLQAETQIPIKTLQVESQPELPDTRIISAPKTENVLKVLTEKYLSGTEGKVPKVLSPTAINTYLNCPLRFYYVYVAKMRKKENPEEGVDAPLMGTIFHDTAKLIYDEIIRHNGGSNTIDKASISNISTRVDQLLDIVFDAHYFHPIEGDEQLQAYIHRMASENLSVYNDYQGELILIRNVLDRYLKNLLKYDLRKAPFTMYAMEVDRYYPLEIQTEQGAKFVNIGGRIDRMDIQADGRLRIVDYKTAAYHANIEKTTMENVFQHDNAHNGYYLQTFLYSVAERLDKDCPCEQIQPCLFYTSKANNDSYEPTLKLDKEDLLDFTDRIDEYVTKLRTIVEEIFNRDKVSEFTQCAAKTKHCLTCEFASLCGR